jgi:transposase
MGLMVVSRVMRARGAGTTGVITAAVSATGGTTGVIAAVSVTVSTWTAVGALPAPGKPYKSSESWARAGVTERAHAIKTTAGNDDAKKAFGAKAPKVIESKKWLKFARKIHSRYSGGIYKSQRDISLQTLRHGQ